ncbi:MAG: leucine-rich repeat domain-containing protein [Sulfuricurvum sp.]|uniref:leucine-rich repeat domain-containing protein n=1 Tax=Sulfuricurvum sp. TaxID=2025608 RepID=UPI0026256780|nr:leucine-rich repeat domain-containing protein [Sulfuricurvum sp.]MDD5161119.1 leucine-rich repeat domain-containing protein [Sulfuricurvum sp.]
MKFILSIIIFIGAFTIALADNSFMKICKNPTSSDRKTLIAIKKFMYDGYDPVRYKQPFQPSDCSLINNALSKAEDLGIGGENVENISLLQFFPNLKNISLSNSNVRDLTPLAKISNLQELDISDNPVTDFKPLLSLKKLETLSIRNDNIADLSILGQIKSLKSLRIYSNGIKDITPFSNLTNLEDLLISSRSLSNICLLNKLTKLKILNMGLSEQVNDISCLKDLKQLEELDITYTKVKKIEVVKNYTHLVSFSGNSSVEDMSPLVGLQKLEYATIHSMHLMECSPSRIEEVRAGKHCTKEDYANLNKPWWKKVLGL